MKESFPGIESPYRTISDEETKSLYYQNQELAFPARVPGGLSAEEKLLKAIFSIDEPDMSQPQQLSLEREYSYIIDRKRYRQFWSRKNKDGTYDRDDVAFYNKELMWQIVDGHVGLIWQAIDRILAKNTDIEINSDELFRLGYAKLIDAVHRYNFAEYNYEFVNYAKKSIYGRLEDLTRSNYRPRDKRQFTCLELDEHYIKNRDESKQKHKKYHNQIEGLGLTIFSGVMSGNCILDNDEQEVFFRYYNENFEKTGRSQTGISETLGFSQYKVKKLLTSAVAKICDLLVDIDKKEDSE